MEVSNEVWRPAEPEVIPLANTGRAEARSADVLIAKCVAPVIEQFLCAPPQRTQRAQLDVSDLNDDSKSNHVANEKKSKRQLKRERVQARKSQLSICSKVWRAGDASACMFGDHCRFSHDLEGFKAQKPDDLEGKCPFFGVTTPCPFGLSCRFYGSHIDVSANGNLSNGVNVSEINLLNKEVQKLLRKNQYKFPIANSVLKSWGLKKYDIVNENDPMVKANCKVPNADASISIDKLGATKPFSEESCSIDEVDGLKISCIETERDILCSSVLESNMKPHLRDKKQIDFRGNLYLAPLTTVGNLPFRRICNGFGADVTCSEMAMCTNLLQGQTSEWALLKRHSSENLFGVQICGAHPDIVARCVELIERECTVDFIDINMGCPIDIVVNKGAGSFLLSKPRRMRSIVEIAASASDIPITIKVRTGYLEGKNRIDTLIDEIGSWGASAVTIHGRSRQQRYSKCADWDFIYHCARIVSGSLQVLGNGDIFSHTDWNTHMLNCPEISSCMIGRGALIKPWIFTEIKEQRHWDISSGERLNILKDYVRFGLQHWGSDTRGVETTRRFLLEWLSYAHRYIPVGLLEVIPQKLNWRPPSYYGRDELETLMASESAADWIRISEMLLGKVPNGFSFTPKHKSNAYDRAENG